VPVRLPIVPMRNMIERQSHPRDFAMDKPAQACL